jgi:hypothetical protein
MKLVYVLFGGILLLGSAVASLSQNPPKPWGPASYLESWQGQPGKADVSASQPVGAGATMACIDVQPRADGSQCVLKYENGGTETLDFRQAITATKTDVVRLTCNAKAAQRSCKVQINSPKKEDPK